MKHPTDAEISKYAANECLRYGGDSNIRESINFAIIDGAKWARGQQPKWIPVEKEVPDTERVVLIVGNNGKMNTAFYSFVRGGRFIPNTPGVSGIYTWTSHWMDLPEGPSNSPKPTTRNE